MTLTIVQKSFFIFCEFLLSAYISTFSAMAAQNITQPRFSSLSENFRISETINTAIIADASIVADCTNNFMEKITQNEVQTNIKPDTSANVNISTIKGQLWLR